MRKVLFILGQLSDSDVDWLAGNGRPERIAKGSLLIRCGTRTSTLYVVLDGGMSVLSPNGMLLGTVASGDILGEMSFVDASAASASVRVDQDSTVLALPHRAIDRKLREDVYFAARFYKALAIFLADRLRNTSRRLGSATAHDASGAAAGGEVDDFNELSELNGAHAASGRENLPDSAQTRHPGASRDPCAAPVPKKIQGMDELDAGVRRHDGHDFGDGSEAGDFDELDTGVLDSVHLAGARFERLLKRLAG